MRLHRAALPGGPLNGWVFHGTSGPNIDRIRYEGLRTTDLHLRDADGDWIASGTHWATPWLASWYAEDCILSAGDAALPLGFVAARITDLAREGDLVPDFASVDFPIVERLGLSRDQLQDVWEKSAGDWSASFRILQAFGCTAPVGPDMLRVITNMDELGLLLSEALMDDAGLLPEQEDRTEHVPSGFRP